MAGQGVGVLDRTFQQLGNEMAGQGVGVLDRTFQRLPQTPQVVPENVQTASTAPPQQQAAAPVNRVSPENVVPLQPAKTAPVSEHAWLSGAISSLGSQPQTMPSSVQPLSAGAYTNGQNVEVFSRSHSGWVHGRVKDVSAEGNVLVQFGQNMKIVEPAVYKDFLRPTAARGPGTPRHAIANQTVANQAGPQAIANQAATNRGGSTIVFLDVDGVLHPTYEAFSKRFHVGCMRALARILKTSGATVVLSSTWRTNPQSIGQVNEALAQYGCNAIADSTPCHATSVREQEISAWLASHAGQVGRWIAIDDIELCGNWADPCSMRMKNHFVHTNKNTGLTEADVELALRLLAQQ
jgi:hypothetical protein